MVCLGASDVTGVVSDAVPGLSQDVVVAGRLRGRRVPRHDHEDRTDCGVGTIPATRTDAECGHERLPCIVRSVVRDIEGYVRACYLRCCVKAIACMREEYRGTLRIGGSLSQAT